MRIQLLLGAVAAGLAFMIWSSDTITLQGERTIYTLTCEGGQWQADQSCSGRVRAGDRYRYRALRAHREVLFWRVGVSEPSRRLTNCDIEDGRTWRCPAGPDASHSVTLQLDHGDALPGPAGQTLPLHATTKWHWWWTKL
ncbi:MAG TPA: hypothetical protein PKC59_12005 [Burkholderiaceae bacterium]|nr:hypothetical protein [Burkholderiaceae bacterium]HMX11492.1 hypothetical protein [Burkholderiaceae bacterium]HMZ01211.1 hypothetical protein [Burkholderiaceae bacterium]HNB44728.1 hypothetical protein [Burkholderiaceae bacterium]HNG79560.1 hypothetical protein [Burkholderiaceae bacterium]